MTLIELNYIRQANIEADIMFPVVDFIRKRFKREQQFLCIN